MGRESRIVLAVPVSKSQPGAVLARPVLNLNGVVLIHEGTELTAAHVRTLKMWGVETVHIFVEAPESSLEEQAPEGGRAEAEAQIQERFKFVHQDTPGVQAVRALAVARLAKRLAAKGSTPTA